MDAVTPNSVSLPGGDIVSVSLLEEAWWTTQNGTGYLPPGTLAPDPKQPRRYMRQDKLAELTESVATCGVRETITITPRSMAPWAIVDPQYEHSFFLIVSGHRRCNAAILAGLKAVPVKVKIYQSEKDHRHDVSILNKDRDDLSELEEGMEIVVLRKLGWSLEQLSASFGHKTPQLYNRMNLTKLHPDIQALLDPEVVGSNRLPGTVAGHLGGVSVPSPDELLGLQDTFSKEVRVANLFREDYAHLSEDDLRFSLQKILLAVILERKLKAVRAIAFIREYTLSMPSHQGRAGRKAERFRPEKRRDIVMNFVESVLGSILMDWPAAEFKKAFDLAPREEIEELVKKLTDAEQFIEGLVKILSRIRDSKKPTHPVALEIQNRRKVASAG